MQSFLSFSNLPCRMPTYAVLWKVMKGIVSSTAVCYRNRSCLLACSRTALCFFSCHAIPYPSEPDVPLCSFHSSSHRSCHSTPDLISASASSNITVLPQTFIRTKRSSPKPPHHVQSHQSKSNHNCLTILSPRSVCSTDNPMSSARCELPDVFVCCRMFAAVEDRAISCAAPPYRSVPRLPKLMLTNKK